MTASTMEGDIIPFNVQTVDRFDGILAFRAEHIITSPIKTPCTVRGISLFDDEEFCFGLQRSDMFSLRVGDMLRLTYSLKMDGN
jgi:hypothetical protein